MDLNIFNFLKRNNNLSENFSQELTNSLNKTELSGNFIINDINNDNISIVNIDTAEEFEILVSTEEKTDCFLISQNDFYLLDLGEQINLNNGICTYLQEKLEINNNSVLSKLEDMFFSLREEEGQIFSVEKIEDNKIYLTNEEAGGYFSIPLGRFPNINVHDKLKKENGKYIPLS